MAVERTGSAYTDAADNESYSESVTVPADADIAMLALSVYYPNQGLSPADFTLGGNSFIDETAGEAGNGVFTQIGYLVNPPTGAQTLAATVPDYGKGITIHVVFYKGVNTGAPITDSDNEVVNQTDVTGLTTGVNDMTFGAAADYGQYPTVTDNSQTQVTSIQGEGGNNQNRARTAEKANSTSFQYTTGGSYATCAAAVIAAAAAGGNAPTGVFDGPLVGPLGGPI